jgi:hypothetical protein
MSQLLSYFVDVAHNTQIPNLRKFHLIPTVSTTAFIEAWAAYKGQPNPEGQAPVRQC